MGVSRDPTINRLLFCCWLTWFILFGVLKWVLVFWMLVCKESQETAENIVLLLTFLNNLKKILQISFIFQNFLRISFRIAFPSHFLHFVKISFQKKISFKVETLEHTLKIPNTSSRARVPWGQFKAVARKLSRGKSRDIHVLFSPGYPASFLCNIFQYFFITSCNNHSVVWFTFSCVRNKVLVTNL